VPSPSYFDVVYLNPDRQAVVPCRVTAPSAKVTLHREFPAKEIPANGTDIVYDMKRGFVYLQPHSDHQGVVYCKAEAGGKSQISVKYQLLYVEGESTFNPQPRDGLTSVSPTPHSSLLPVFDWHSITFHHGAGILDVPSLVPAP
jgi:hypothetical protein